MNSSSMKIKLTILTCSLLLSSSIALAESTTDKTTTTAPQKSYDLLAVYNIAQKDNASYNAAVATFHANQQNVPISLGALLPNVQLQTGLQYNYAQDPGAGKKTNYTSVNPNPMITLTQSVFDWALWKTYTQSQYQFKADAMTLAQNRQQLILNTATSYFNILQAQDQLRFAKANVNWNKQLLDQTEQKFKVGISAITDVQSSKANYENAVAQYVKNENTLKNAYNTLYQITGKKINSIDELKDDFPFNKPSPDNANDWVKTALMSNLLLIQSRFNLQASEEGIDVAWGAFIPSANFTVTGNRTLNYQTANLRGVSTANAGINVTWNVLNGGSDYATLKQAKYTSVASQQTLEQNVRDTESQTTQSYLNVVSDISQVNALHQSVVANESSVRAMKAGYNVGTQTIVDLLNRQQILFDTQQQYALARYSYINALLTLKQQAGTLTIKDIENINQWLDNQKNSTYSGT